MLKKVALYARVSTKNQDVEPQVEELKRWAEYREVEFDVFSEQRSITEERPAFNHMMELIRDGAYGAVVFRDLDRVGRSVAHLSSWGAELSELGVELVALRQSIDTATKEGRLMFNLLASVAEFEREIGRERMEHGFRKAVEEGRVGRPRINLPVDRMREMRDNGASYRYIANMFGVSRDTVRDRLKNSGEK